MNRTNSIYGRLNYESHWYALRTRGRHEKKVDMRLKQIGVVSYLPLTAMYHRWSDRYKKVLEPLFSCYVFVNIALCNRFPVLQTDGAVNLVAFNGVPAVIPEEQLSAIKHILENNQRVDCVDYFTPGKKVKVVRGPLRGLQGVLVLNKNNNRLIISIDGIKQAISVEIDLCDVELI